MSDNAQNQENTEQKNKNDFPKNSNNHNGKDHKHGDKNSFKKDHKPRTFVVDKTKTEKNTNAKPKGNGKKERKPEPQYQVDKLFKVTQKEYDEQFLKFLEFINKDSLDNLNAVVDYMAELCSIENEKERNKNKKKINKILIDPKFISVFTNMKNRSSKIYEVLRKFDDKFDLKNYADLTLDMGTIFYGSIVTEEDGTHNFKLPLSSKSIYRLIEIILDNDKTLASKWIYEVFSYNKENLRNRKFEDTVNPDSDDFRKILKNNPVAHQIYEEMIFEKKPFQTVIEVKNTLKQSEAESKRKITELEESKRQLESNVLYRDDKIRTLTNELDTKTKEFNELNTQKGIVENERSDFKFKFESLTEIYSKQMNLAKKIQDDYHQLQIDSANKEKEDEAYINQLEDQIEKLSKQLEVEKADSALKSHKLSEAESAKATSGSEARSTTMKNLVQKISSPFYYLSMFCQEFNENQKLSEDSAPFFVDTVNQIEAAFALMGAKKVGKLDDIVKFDTSIHEPMGGTLSNGDLAKITEPGWKIEDEIFIKAKVEKAEEK